MTFEEKVRKTLAATPFAEHERRNLLKVVIGELQRKPVNSKMTDDIAYGVVKGIIKANEELMSYLTRDTRKYEELETECDILRSLLPSYLSAEEIFDQLSEDAVRECKSEGQAVGLAMKHFKEHQLPVEGDTVKKVVIAMRS